MLWYPVLTDTSSESNYSSGVIAEEEQNDNKRQRYQKFAMRLYLPEMSESYSQEVLLPWLPKEDQWAY